MRQAVTTGMPWETASTLHALMNSLAQVAVAVPTVRRVAFLTVSPDVQTAAVSRLTARTLARHRTGRILSTTRQPAAPIPTLRSPSPEQLAHLPEELRHSLDLDRKVWVAPPDIDDRFFDVHCTDWGMRGATTGALEVSAGAHIVCIVSSVVRAAADPAVALAEALAAREGEHGAVLAFTTARAGASTAWARAVEPYLSVPSVVFDHDPALATAARRPPRRRTERAFIQLAAHLLTGGIQPGRADSTSTTGAAR
jgi:hypothetical protein